MGGSLTLDWLWYAAKIPAAYSTVTTWDTVWIWELQSSATRSTKAIPVVITGQCFYLGFIVWERSPEWPKATSFLGWSGGIPPRSFFEINMCRDAIWCIFERQFWEMLQCVHWPRQVWMIFPICLLIYCNDTLFFGGGGGGGSFYPSNTLDRTLHVKLLFTLSSMNNKG